MYQLMPQLIEKRVYMENSYEIPNKSKDVSLKELSDRLAEFAEVRGWEKYHSPRNLLLALVRPLTKPSIFPNFLVFHF